MMPKHRAIELTIGLLVILSLAAAAKVLLRAPFWIPGDVFAYLGYAQNIVDTHQIQFLGLSGATGLYTYFPLLFLQIALGNLLTGISVPAMAVVINLLCIALLPLSFYAVSIALFHNRQAALFTTLFSITGGFVLSHAPHPNEVFPNLSTWTISFLFFAATIVYFFRILQERPRVHLRTALPFALLLSGTILFHPQSSIFRGSIFAFSAVLFWLLSRGKERGFFLRLFALASLPWIVFLSFNVANISDFLTLGKAVAIDNSLGLPSAFVTPNLLTPFGAFLILSTALMCVFLFKKRVKLPPFTVWFFLLYVGIIFLFSNQGVLGLSFFPQRLAGELTLPLALFGGIGALKTFDLLGKNRWVMKIGILLIATVGIISYMLTISRASFDADWSFVQVMEWTNHNIKGSKVLADPYTLYMLSGFADLSPAYAELRTLKNISNNPYITNVFFSQNAKSAYNFLQQHHIEYVMYDTNWDPNWIGGYYKKFEDKTKYELVFSVRQHVTTGEFRIYRVR